MIRNGGHIGSTLVTWTVSDDNSYDLLAQTGTVELLNGEGQTSIILSVRPDTIPELDELFHIQLTSVSRVGMTTSSCILYAPHFSTF